MSKLRVNAFSVSADGFGAGPDQSRDQPLGRGGEQLHQWFLPTRTFQREVLRRDGGTTGTDNDFAARSFENLGAWIMGRNMFGPVRGPWPDDEWKGWWGANPPYHVPVFVLTHHARPPLEMEGGTVFHFVTEGIAAALDQARAAARSPCACGVAAPSIVTHCSRRTPITTRARPDPLTNYGSAPGFGVRRPRAESSKLTSSCASWPHSSC